MHYLKQLRCYWLMRYYLLNHFHYQRPRVSRPSQGHHRGTLHKLRLRCRPSEVVPIGPSNPLGSLGSRLSSACASACELKLAQSNWSCASAGLVGLSICWKVRAPTTPATSTNATTAATFNDVGLILINIVRVSVRRRCARSTVDDSVLDDATL